MATETLAPDAIVSSSGLNGAVGDIQEDPGSNDGNWMTTSASDGSLRTSFPTPTGNPTTGPDVQAFRALLRKNATGGGDPTYVAELRETGGVSALQTLATNVAITAADPGEIETLSWDASNLATADGSAVELLLTFSKGGGGPNERNIEVGAIAWDVDYVVGQNLVKVLSELLQIDEVLVKALVRIRITTESENFNEGLVRPRLIVRPVGEVIQVVESLVPSRVIIRVISEVEQFIEDINFAIGKSEIIDETLELSETWRRVKRLRALFADIIATAK